MRTRTDGQSGSLRVGPSPRLPVSRSPLRRVPPSPRLRVFLFQLALWMSPNNREDVHNGELEGIIELQGNTATYETEGCKVTIRFFSTTAIVTQDSKIGDCDFGANVTASGIYRKLNSRQPKFGIQSLISKSNHQ